jgi:chromosome segregation ATPase
MPRLSATEKLERATQALSAAKAELAQLPPKGRERTAIINRARGHLNTVRRNAYRLADTRFHDARNATPGQREQAKALMDAIDNLWPDPKTGR